MQDGKLDIDLPNNHYLLDLPKLFYNGKDQTITSRQLMNHSTFSRTLHKVFLNKKFDTVVDFLELFIHDPPVIKPGSAFSYSTHGYTLLSVVMEQAASFELFFIYQDLFYDLGMRNTILDFKDIVILKCARYHFNELSEQNPYLSAATAHALWKQNQDLNSQLPPGSYGFGWVRGVRTKTYGKIKKNEVRSNYWQVSRPTVWIITVCTGITQVEQLERLLIWFTQTSSSLVVLPFAYKKDWKNGQDEVCVAILLNLQDCWVSDLALELAEIQASLFNVRAILLPKYLLPNCPVTVMSVTQLFGLLKMTFTFNYEPQPMLNPDSRQTLCCGLSAA
ncbi:hypothetical protein L596_001820 [Steinernema carpocapsae]|uniref:Beta-lactamase-related domain-containing protein n=1 Tax=Steinernema carpocapsae TaxID=34508 RepID=A0A4U8UMV7_STECR|nr:hypothetical protein L596_001820 [Steinernema carpocapsae]